MPKKFWIRCLPQFYAGSRCFPSWIKRILPDCMTLLSVNKPNANIEASTTHLFFAVSRPSAEEILSMKNFLEMIVQESLSHAFLLDEPTSANPSNSRQLGCAWNRCKTFFPDLKQGFRDLPLKGLCSFPPTLFLLNQQFQQGAQAGLGYLCQRSYSKTGEGWSDQPLVPACAEQTAIPFSSDCIRFLGKQSIPVRSLSGIPAKTEHADMLRQSVHVCQVL